MPRITNIQARKGTATDWSTQNPVLASGELGYDLTNKILKLGDGTTSWSTLSTINLTASNITDFNSSVSGLLSNSLTQTTADARYVELTGDTMTGGLTINAATPLNVTGGRTFLAPNSEPYGLGVKYHSSGGAVYFGATDATTTPGMQISKAGGVAMITCTNAGAVSIPGTLTVGGSSVLTATSIPVNVINSSNLYLWSNFR